jgi:hypothetical protein
VGGTRGLLFVPPACVQARERVRGRLTREYHACGKRSDWNARDCRISVSVGPAVGHKAIFFIFFA